jgi:hypothetical protein
MVDEPKNLRASYGHDVECLWLGMDAVRALGWPEALHPGWARNRWGITASSTVTTPSMAGSFIRARSGQEADDTKKEWWVQAEALVGMLDMYRLTGEAVLSGVCGHPGFIERHQVAREGGVVGDAQADGTASCNDLGVPCGRGPITMGGRFCFPRRYFSITSNPGRTDMPQADYIPSRRDHRHRLHRPAHIEALKRLGVQVTAIVDNDRAKVVADKWRVPHAITDLDHKKLVTHPEVDVVHIASPNKLHAQHAADALKAGKHVDLREALGDDLEGDGATAEAVHRGPGRCSR